LQASTTEFNRLTILETPFSGAEETFIMRDYALNRAISLEEGNGFSLFSRIWRNWKARKRVSDLSSYDDYMLRDIGVTRDEVQWAAGLPLSVNAALALEERSFQRRRHSS
jgi:uncharacterized protein YjiS (DUF1127 family)